MAGQRLPAAVQEILETPVNETVVQPEVEPVRVHAGGEVHDVEVALNKVQDSAVSLAVEQATLRRNIADAYVNLGRRNQNLLSRQLEFITQLENDESDPETLEHLFRLDHLATRMRRNAESLLVLAGLAPPRTWSAPVAMGDVVRGALGEVEGYRRVRLRHVDDARVDGAAAADVSHVIAELVENALSFSPPDADVEVYGRRDDHGYVITIIDSGIGMHDEELERGERADLVRERPDARAVALPRSLRGRAARGPTRADRAPRGVAGRRPDRDDRAARRVARDRRTRPSSTPPDAAAPCRADRRAERPVARACRAATRRPSARPVDRSRAPAAPIAFRAASRAAARHRPELAPATPTPELQLGRRRCDERTTASPMSTAARVRRRRRRVAGIDSTAEVDAPTRARARARCADAAPEPAPELGARAGAGRAAPPHRGPAPARARLLRRPAGRDAARGRPRPSRPSRRRPSPTRRQPAAAAAPPPGRADPDRPAVVAPDRRASFAEVAQAVDVADRPVPPNRRRRSPRTSFRNGCRSAAGAARGSRRRGCASGPPSQTRPRTVAASAPRPPARRRRRDARAAAVAQRRRRVAGRDRARSARRRRTVRALPEPDSAPAASAGGGERFAFFAAFRAAAEQAREEAGIDDRRGH